jgi:hypothetical protein
VLIRVYVRRRERPELREMTGQNMERPYSCGLAGLASCGRTARAPSGRLGQWRAISQSPECFQEEQSSRILAEQLDIVLPRVSGELGRHAKQPRPEPFGLSRPPATRQGCGSDEVQELVGQGVERPEQGIAFEVIDGGLAGGELAQLLDPLLDEGALVVEPPGADGVDPLQIGQHMGALGDLVGVEFEGLFGGQGPTGLERKQSAAPERARGGPGLGAREDPFATLRAAPGALVIAQPAVMGDLEKEMHIELEERLHHRAAEEALVEPHGNLLHAGGAKPAHQEAQPFFGARSGVGTAGAPAHAQAVARLLEEGQEGMVRRPARLLRIVALLGSRLLIAITDRDGGVQDQGELARDPDQGPARQNEPPNELVGDRDQGRGRAAQPPPEGGGVGNADPAEDAPHAPAFQQRQIVHDPSAVEEQGHPELDHEAGTEAAGHMRRPPVDPRAEMKCVPQASKKEKSGAVGQAAGAVTEPERSTITLNLRPGFDTMVSHRLGVLRRETLLPGKSLQRMASGGVLHPQFTLQSQDPG